MSLKVRSSFEQFFQYSTPTISEDCRIDITDLPMYFKISQNDPNPVKDSTYIRFQVPFECSVTIRIYDLNGTEVKTLVDEIKEPGCYIVNWDCTNNEGARLPSGSYFYNMQTFEFVDIKRMLLL